MVPVLPSRRPRESGGPGRRVRRWQPWVPAFAGMTMRGAGTKRQIRTTSFRELLPGAKSLAIRRRAGQPRHTGTRCGPWQFRSCFVL